MDEGQTSSDKDSGNDDDGSVGSSPVAASLGDIRKRISDASLAVGRSQDSLPRLVAVSKTKPVELLRAAYDAGCRDFGENYVQELLEKAPEMPDDVAWRYIGALQARGAKKLVKGVPTLHCIETVASEKLADTLQNAVASLDTPRKTPLQVMIQVNTSPWEGTKSGVLVEEAPDLAEHIVKSCPDLKFLGLMTIGAAGNSSCFESLVACRDSVAQRIGADAESLELSMGMSGDFEAAISKGSTSVRVGSSIFGARSYPAKQ